MSAIGTNGLRDAGIMSREFIQRARGMHRAKPKEDRMKVQIRKHLPAESKARWFWERIKSGRFTDPVTVAAITREHGSWFAKFEEAKA